MNHKDFVKSYHNSIDRLTHVLKDIFINASKKKAITNYRENLSDAARNVLANLQLGSIMAVSTKTVSLELSANHTFLTKKIANVEVLLATTKYKDICVAIDELTLALADSLELVEKEFGVKAEVSDFPMVDRRKAA